MPPRLRYFRSTSAALALASLMIGGAAAAQERTYPFDLAGEPLSKALRDYGRTTGQQLLFTEDLTAGKMAPALHGPLTAADALQRLLAGSGLSAIRTQTGALVLQRQSAPVPPVGAAQAATPTSSTVDELIVTAQKREERLQDVPIPVAAVTGETLAARNQVRLQDYFVTIPGLSATPVDENGAPQLAIRGITTGGYSNPTVGFVIDDVPFGSSSYFTYGNDAPDIDPADLSRVEVLRGPQGTLYGAASMGGLLKFVTVDPSTSGVFGRVEGGISSVYHGRRTGYSLRGSVNAPLSETLAVRVSAFTREDPGYITDVQTGERGVNRTDVKGWRLSALWRPVDTISLKLSALRQDTRVDGSPEVQTGPGLGDLEQSTLRRTGWRRGRIDAYSATLNADLGDVKFVSVTGYNYNLGHSSYDFSPSPFWGGQMQANFGVGGAPLLTDNSTRRVTEELRFSGTALQSVDWLVGAFYSHERSLLFQRVLPANVTTGQVVGDFFNFRVPLRAVEYAAFADATIHFTDRFDVQIGGRESRYEQNVSEAIFGPYVPVDIGVPSPLLTPQVQASSNSFTYVFTPRFRVSPDLMVYGRIASGFRAGGANANPTTTLPQFRPDTTVNYEVGAKGDLFERMLSYDVSLYYIDWKDIQLQLRDPGTGIVFFANGSRAKSQGVELSLQARPGAGIKAEGWVSVGDAVLTEDLPAASTAVGRAGDRLPNSSRVSGSVSLEKTFTLGAGASAFVGGSASYVGSRESVFLGTRQRQVFPAYTQVDLRAGVERNNWRVNLFLNNVGDERGVLAGGLGSLNPNAFYYTQPRTVGVTISSRF